MSCGSTHETQVQYLNTVRSGKYGVGSSSCEEGIEEVYYSQTLALETLEGESLHEEKANTIGTVKSD
jgi:hypothetical protein